MKKKKTNSLLALNYYWHDEKIDSSNDSLCVKKWYFGVQHLNESWVMPLEIFSVQICADEMVLIENLHKKHLRVGEIDVNFLICHLDVLWVLSCQSSLLGGSLARQAANPEKRLTSRWKPRKVEAWVSTERGLCWKEWPAELRRPPWWKAHLTNRPMTLLVFVFVCSVLRKKNWLEKYFVLRNTTNCIHLID